MGCAKLELSFEWTIVESSPGVFYLFPGEVTNHIKTHYNGPAVYRWNVFRDRPGDLGLFYLGETDLLPRRLGKYLRSDETQQTNRRLNGEFQERREDGQRIMLEVVSFSPFELGGLSFSMQDLGNKYFRRFLENWLAIFHQRSGHRILNR